MDNQQSSLASALDSLPIPKMGGFDSSTDKLVIILKSKTIMRQVIKNLNLMDHIVRSDRTPSGGSGLFNNVKSFFRNILNRNSKTIDPRLKRFDDSISYLKKRTRIADSKSGLIKILVEWDDPEIGADIVNTYVTLLGDFINDNSLNINLKVIDAALPPTNKYTPKVFTIIMSSGLLSLTFGIFLIIFWNNVKGLKQEKQER